MKIAAEAGEPVLAPRVVAVHDRRHGLSGAGIFLLRPCRHPAAPPPQMHLDRRLVELPLLPAVAPTGNRVRAAYAIRLDLRPRFRRDQRGGRAAPVDRDRLNIYRPRDHRLAAVRSPPHDRTAVRAAVKLSEDDGLCKAVDAVGKDHLDSGKPCADWILADQRAHLLLRLLERPRPRAHIYHHA